MKPKVVDWSGATRRQKVQRWENVLRVLRSLTPHQRKKHWDMRHWGLVTECGTVACAAGHCGLDAWFKGRGFGAHFAEWGWNGWDHFTPREFFGADGTGSIFYDATPRSVKTVILEVESYIKTQLRDGTND